MCKLVFNSFAVIPKKSLANKYNNDNKKHMYEMPLPLYVAMIIHVLTRSRNLIGTLYGLGYYVFPTIGF